MPEKLNFKILPRVDSWPQAFQIAPPTYEDIALYFFSSEVGRQKEKYIRLLEHIESRDFAMKTCVDGVELLVYTSKQLPQDSQRIDEDPFLWGVFRHLKHKKQCQDKQQQSLSCISAAVMNSTSLGQFDVSSDASCQEVDKVSDMVGGSKAGRIDRPILRIDAPPGFPKPISRDAPPGFSKPISRYVSHLKHKKQCQHKKEQSLSCISASVMKSTSLGQSDVSSDGTRQEVDMEIDMVGGIEIGRIDRPILRIDAPPFPKPISRDVSHLKHKKQCQDIQEQALSCISASVMKSTSLGQSNVSSDGTCQEVDMEIDMVAGIDVGRIDRPILRIDAPPFSETISRDVSHLKHKKQCQDIQEQSLSCISASVMKSTSIGQFNVSSDDNCQEVDMEIDMVGGREIGRVDIPILRIDGPLSCSKPISRDAPGFSKPISSDVCHDRRSLAKFLPHVAPRFSKTTFKHGCSSPDLTLKSQNLCMKDKRGSVSFSSGEDHTTTNLEACEGQPKCQQVSGHRHKSVEHGFSNHSAGKKKEFDSIDRYSYAKEKTPPWTDTNPCSASISLPCLSAKKKVDSSSEKPLQKSCTMFGDVVLSSTSSSNEKQESRFFKKPANYGDRYSHMTDTEAHCLHRNMAPNSSKEKGHRPSGKPSDKNFAQEHRFGKGVSPSGTGIKESKITSCMMVPKATEGNEKMGKQSTPGRRQEMRMIAPGKQSSKTVKEMMERQSNSNPENKQISQVSANYGSPSSSLIQPLLSGSKRKADGLPDSKTMVSDKWHLKEDIKRTKNMENQCGLVEGKKQQYPVSPSYGTPVSISVQPLLSTGGDLLSFLPQDSEPMKTPKTITSTERQAVSRDLRLSRPECMKDGTA
uniref:Uncharacterized protein LOC114914824 n=2 Tax=Elaeis guineensis var. tenera TaxID=51953 RepID=A0A8N4F438_ELAGV|nr:uncharacterized protein LOC114914824 [Elaeis guineensis]